MEKVRSTAQSIILIPGLFLLILAHGCDRGESPAWTGADSLRVINETLQYRRDVERYFRDHPSSPFRADPPIRFEGLRWYPPDVNMYFVSRLQRYERPETVIVLGTKNEERQQIRYGYFPITVNGQNLKLNVYKFTEGDIRQRPELREYLSVWFTDQTTGDETYEVGRYVEIEQERADPDHLYVVNLNNAHNPYCAYNPDYSCAIPTREDHLPVPIRAGEMKYHAD